MRILAGYPQHVFQDSVFGFTLPPVFASVYYESALRLAKIENAEFEAPSILGCVIAHEIGHLLLGPNSHTTTGIMRPQWESNQIRQIMKGEFVFTGEQSALIQAEVHRRKNEQSAGAVAARLISSAGPSLRMEPLQQVNFAHVGQRDPIMRRRLELAHSKRQERLAPVPRDPPMVRGRFQHLRSEPST